MSATLIPLIFPIVNLLSVYYLDTSCKKSCETKSVKGVKIGVFALYTLLLFAALILRSDLVGVSRTVLYKYMPFMFVWLLLTLVYFVLPAFVSVATIYESNRCYRKECNKYAYQGILFIAYFTLVYLLLNIRVTQNWQVLDKQICY